MNSEPIQLLFTLENEKVENFAPVMLWDELMMALGAGFSFQLFYRSFLRRVLLWISVTRL
jgi:hypothetical protein